MRAALEELASQLGEAPAAWLEVARQQAGQSECDSGVVPQQRIADALTGALLHAVQAALLDAGEDTAACEGEGAAEPRRDEQAAERRRTHILGASTVIAVVPKPLSRAQAAALSGGGAHAHQLQHTDASGAAAEGHGVADDEEECEEVEGGGGSEGDHRPAGRSSKRGKGQRQRAPRGGKDRSKPQPQQPQVEIEVEWYAMAAVLCQEASRVETTTTHARSERGAASAQVRSPDRLPGGVGGGGLGGAAAAGGGRGARATARVARLCYVRDGVPGELEEPVERGIRRVPWDQYGIRLVDLTCGSTGQGTLVHRPVEGEAGCPWGVTHVVLSLFLDGGPLEELRSRLACLGVDRPLPKRLRQLGAASELALVRQAVAGALGDAKAQLQVLQAQHHARQQEHARQQQQEDARQQQQELAPGGDAGGVRGGAGRGGGEGVLLQAHAGTQVQGASCSPDAVDGVPLGAGSGASRGASAAPEQLPGAAGGGGPAGPCGGAAGPCGGAAGPCGGAAVLDTGSFLMSRLESRLNAALPAVADALAGIVHRAYNPNLAPFVCRALNCTPAGLSDALYGAYGANIATWQERQAAAREERDAGRKRGRPGGSEKGEVGGAWQGGAYGGGDVELEVDGGEMLRLGGDGAEVGWVEELEDGCEDAGAAWGGGGAADDEGLRASQEEEYDEVLDELQWIGSSGGAGDGAERDEEGSGDEEAWEGAGGEGEDGAEGGYGGEDGDTGAGQWAEEGGEAEQQDDEGTAEEREQEEQGPAGAAHHQHHDHQQHQQQQHHHHPRRPSGGQQHVPAQPRPCYHDPLEFVGAMLGVKPLRVVNEAACGREEGGGDGDEEGDWAF